METKAKMHKLQGRAATQSQLVERLKLLSRLSTLQLNRVCLLNTSKGTQLKGVSILRSKEIRTFHFQSALSLILTVRS